MFLIRLSVVVLVGLLGLSFLDFTEGRSRRRTYSQKDLDSYEDYYTAKDYKHSYDEDEEQYQGYEYRGSYGNKASKSPSHSRIDVVDDRHDLYKPRDKDRKGRFFLTTILSGLGLSSIASAIPIASTAITHLPKIVSAGKSFFDFAKNAFGSIKGFFGGNSEQDEHDNVSAEPEEDAVVEEKVDTVVDVMKNAFEESGLAEEMKEFVEDAKKAVKKAAAKEKTKKATASKKSKKKKTVKKTVEKAIKKAAKTKNGDENSAQVDSSEESER